MKKIAAMLAVGVATMMGLGTAHALPTPDGSFTLVPTGGTPITVDTGNITLATGLRTVAAWAVDTVSPNLTLALSNGSPAAFSSTSLIVPSGIAAPATVSFTLDAGPLSFIFNTGVTNSRVGIDIASGVAGSFSDQFSGTLRDGGGIYENGAAVTLSESCTQPSVLGHAGLIACSDAVVTISQVIPEPSSLALLGVGLLGLVVLRRVRVARTNRA